MKVKEFFDLRSVDGDVGVEIEVEGKNLPRAPQGWRAEADGSLKAAESLEFVMTEPVPITKLADSLQALKDAFDKKGSRFDLSYRAGIHVHVNVQELSMVQLATMLTTYYIFEDSLINLCDPFRKGNHFCLRASDASGQIRRLRNAFAENNPYKFDGDEIRYSTMNVCAIPRYGSVEFRSLESTDDFGKVHQFATMHHSLRQFAREVKDPVAVMDLAYHIGTDGLCEKVFQQNARHLLSQNTFRQDSEQGLELSEDLAFCRPWGIRSLDIFAVRKEVF